MRTLAQKLHNYWFQPLSPDRLAILRIATGGFSLWYLLSRYSMLLKLSASDLAMFEPVGLVSWMSNPMSPDLFHVLLLSALLLNIAYILGWKYRWTGPLFALTLLFLLSYRNSWTMIYHNRIALVLHVLVIGMVQAADTLSWDAWQKAKFKVAEVKQSWRYGWPVKLICTATVLTYFLSGIAKISGELGWDWITGEAMRSQVAIDAIRKVLLGGSTEPLFEWLYPHNEIFLLMGIGTMIIELGAPFALAGKRIGIAWVLLTWLLHWGIFFIMGIRFRYQMSGVIFLSFFDLEKPYHWIKKQFRGHTENKKTKPQSASSIVLFDGNCNLCDASVRFIIDRDPQRHFQFASLQSAVGKKLLLQHDAPADLSTIVLIERDKIYTKSSAVLRICRYLKGGWPILYTFIFIPFSIRDACYHWLASRRYTLFGRKHVCEIPIHSANQRFLS
jgi:predicted DCC family thiol-disulfide oxidoreductase YuxK